MALLGAVFLGNLDAAIVNVAAPAIRAGLDASGGALELAVAGYAPAYAALRVTGARLGGVHGYRRVLLGGLAAFSFASLLPGLAPGVAVLIAARIAQGAGAALMIPQVLAGIQLDFTGAARRRALGLDSVVLSGSAVIGQAASGTLISASLFGAGWRPTFALETGTGLALMAAARSLPAGRPQRSRRLDWAGDGPR